MLKVSTVATASPLLIAFWKMIHFQIPDPGPIDIDVEEAPTLAREAIRALAAYLPDEERARLNLDSIVRRDEKRSDSARGVIHLDMKDSIEVMSRKVNSAPGCCLRIGGHLVCVALPKAST